MCSLVVTVVVFDEVLQQVDAPLCLDLIDFDEILRKQTDGESFYLSGIRVGLGSGKPTNPNYYT